MASTNHTTEKLSEEAKAPVLALLAIRLLLLAVAAAAVMLLSRRCATVPTLLLSVLLLLLPAGTAYAWM